MSDAELQRLIGLYNRSDWQAAIELGARLAARRPLDAMIPTIVGAAEAGRGQFDLAAAAFRRAAELEPGKAERHANLALALQQAGQIEAAVASFDAALRLRPKDPAALNGLGALLIQQNRFAEARRILGQAVRAQPDQGLLWSNMALALRGDGALQEAEQAFRRALALDPGDVEALHGLGGVLTDSGQTAAALASFQAAVKAAPRDARLHRSVAIVLRDLGRLRQAAAAYGAVAEIDPDDAEAHYSRGRILSDLGDKTEALASFETAVARKPDYPAALNALGAVRMDLGQTQAAAEAFVAALALVRDYPPAQNNLARLAARKTPPWHIAMMNDLPRNEAFRQAIEATVRDGDFVLEIGAGSGLLAMIAADCGAGQVITCEVAPDVAALAAEITAQNGFERRIAVLNKRSTALELPHDLPRRADVLIAEILSSEFVGEGVVSSLADARRRLLAPGGRMIPSGGAIMAGLLGDHPGARSMLHVGEAYGYDLSAFNRASARRISIPATVERLPIMSDAVEAFQFDFLAPTDVHDRETDFVLEATSDGLCLGIAQWNRVVLTDAIVYENHPARVLSHWSIPVYRFDAPLRLTAGDRIRVYGALTEDNVWFSAEAPS